MINQRWWWIQQFPSAPTVCVCAKNFVLITTSTQTWLQHESCWGSVASGPAVVIFRKHNRWICEVLLQLSCCRLVVWSQTPKPVNFCSAVYIWGFLLPSDSGLCIWISRQLQNDLNPGHTGGVDVPSLWCFPTSPLKCLMSLYALIVGNGGRMWSHLLGNVSCSYGSRRPHTSVYPVSTAHRLVHE